MAQKIHSQKCPACNNMVRVDYPSFPYCRFHQHLSDSTNSMVTKNTQQGNFTGIRETLYNPGKTSVPKSKSALDRVTGAAQFTGLSEADVARTVQRWGEATRGIDTLNPSQCRQSQKDTLDVMRHAMSDIVENNPDFTHPSVGVAECKNASVALPGGGIVPLRRPHGVVYVTSDNNATIILDPLPAAALDGLTGGKNADEIFPPGHSMFTDRMSLSTLYEYAGYSSLDIDSIADTSTGQTLWDSHSSLGGHSNELERQRAAVAKHGPQNFPKPIYQRSPTAEQWEDNNRNNHKSTRGEKKFDDNLDALFDL